MEILQDERAEANSFINNANFIIKKVGDIYGTIGTVNNSYMKNSFFRIELPIRTIRPKNTVQFWSCNKTVANVFPHRVEPSSVTKTGQYLLDCWYNKQSFPKYN